MLNRAPASSTLIELSADAPGLAFPDSITVPPNVRRWTFPITANDRVTTSGDVVFAAHTSSPSQYSTESVLLRLTGEPVLRDSGSLKLHSDHDQLRSGDKCPCSLWTDEATPAVESTPDDRPVEVGVRFRSSTNGYITAIRFYKGYGNRGPHTGHVWTAAGHLLASVSFNHETASGWQMARLEGPVHIRAGMPYVVSYYAPHGQYASTHRFFRPPMRSGGVLYAPLDGAGGGNGIFHYGSQQFPTDSYESTNYWVDVVISNDTAVP